MTIVNGYFRIKEALRPCPICNQAEVYILHTQKFVMPDEQPLKYEYDVVYCTNCGFVYADTQLTQTDYDNLYKIYSKYEDKYISSGAGDNLCDRDRFRQITYQVSNFLTNREARILDIGCANGGLLRMLSNKGYKNIIGIDPSPTCVHNTQQLEISAFTGSIFSLPKEIGKVDCIILSHVLEHIQELRSAIQTIRSILNDYGWIYVEVPDAMRYKDEVISPFQEFNTEHINHFSQICISNLMGQEGFKLFKSDEKSFESSPGKPYSAIFSIWRKFSPIEPFSNSLNSNVDLLRNILEYIRKSSALMQAFDDKIRAILKTYPEIIVWGTGQ